MKRISLFFSFLFLFTAGILCQNMLSIEECRSLAIENNKSLKMATEQERVAYYQKKDAITKYFPDLSFRSVYLRNGKNLNIMPSSIIMPDLSGIPGVSLPIPPGTEVPLSNNIRKIGEVDIKNIWIGAFSLTQPIFMGGKIIAYNDIEKYAEELAKSQKDTQLKEVIVETDNTYWQVVSLANKKKLALAYVELLQKMEHDVTLMEEQGLATKADYLSVSVKLNEAEVALAKVENGLSLSKMLLCQICGLPIEETVTLKDENINDLGVLSEAAPELNIGEALANRSEIRSLELATKMHEKKEKIVFSEFLPQLALSANYLWTNPSAFNGIEYKVGGMWNVGVVLKVPLNFASSSHKLSAAKAQTRIAKFRLDEAKEKIELQVNQSSYKFSEANKKLKMTAKNKEKADENLRYAKAGFDEGVIPASDVLGAHTAWMSAQAEHIDAQIDLKLCKIYLNKALGRNF